MLRSTPHVIENAAERCNINHWNAEYLSEHGGEHLCNVTEYGRPVTPSLSMTYESFFGSYHARGWYTFTRLPRVRAPPFLKKANIGMDYQRHIVYSGIKGTGALPHCHGEAFNILVSGEKSWIFFDANVPSGMALQKQFNQSYPYRSVVKIAEFFSDPRLDEYEKQGHKVIRLTQHAGQGVFVPKGWTHAVLNEADCLGLVLEL